ncbi:unnamed protein product [Kuraishia capsulata CBS 1993]|uniref:Arrestin C-terminal-like domain-containing protein n=1 Tax=Kuraishia capsulata CBS 1993 TaxID=1382522 RepID=W6MTJ0_9ASCO|nr:uncharacterized protein KUCA_T00005766001 [Kuraishia capsulata CBS 1993]CDK29773.1 unnamed protein product [Kuraishia capsulata CBS 1993]
MKISTQDPLIVYLKPNLGGHVLGLPGLVDTKPRIEGVLRIQARNSVKPFSIERVETKFTAFQSALVGADRLLGSKEVTEKQILGSEDVIFDQADSPDSFYTEIKFTLLLPEKLYPTLHLVKKSKHTTVLKSHSFLEFKVFFHYKGLESLSVIRRYPIPITLFDSWLTLHEKEKISVNQDFQDGELALRLDGPYSYVGPGDSLPLVLSLAPINLTRLETDIHVKTIEAKIVEKVTFPLSGIPPVVTVITEAVSYPDTVVPVSGRSFELNVAIPSYFDKVSADPGESLDVKVRVDTILEKHDSVDLTPRATFSPSLSHTSASLFGISHSLTLTLQLDKRRRLVVDCGTVTVGQFSRDELAKSGKRTVEDLRYAKKYLAHLNSCARAEVLLENSPNPISPTSILS